MGMKGTYNFTIFCDFPDYLKTIYHQDRCNGSVLHSSPLNFILFRDVGAEWAGWAIAHPNFTQPIWIKTLAHPLLLLIRMHSILLTHFEIASFTLFTPVLIYNQKYLKLYTNDLNFLLRIFKALLVICEILLVIKYQDTSKILEIARLGKYK